MIAGLWGLIAAWKRARGPAPAPAGLRIVCIGNVLVGGTGKSPIVRWFAERGLARGERVVIVARGVGPRGNVLVRAGSTALRAAAPAVRWDGGEALSDENAEHLLLLAAAFPQAQIGVFQGPDRQAALREIASWGNGALVLLDDGLQSTRTPRHRNVVVWNPELLAKAPRFCMPVGPYREGFPWTFERILAADEVRVWSRCREADLAQFRNKVLALRPSQGRDFLCCGRLELRHVSSSLEIGDVAMPGEGAGVVCGIAQPERFLHDLRAHLGRELPALCLADHGTVRGEEWAAHLRPWSTVVVTAKDLCRWWQEPGFHAALARKTLIVALLRIELCSLEGVPLNSRDWTTILDREVQV